MSSENIAEELSVALKNNECARVEELIANDADVNQADAEGLRPLQNAAQTGCMRCIELLLNNGADIRATIELWWRPDEDVASTERILLPAPESNLGFGIRTTLGNKMVLATHCAFAANVAGGFVADPVQTVPMFSEGAAVSCIAWRASSPVSSVMVLPPTSNSTLVVPFIFIHCALAVF